MSISKETLIKMVLDAWNTHLQRAEKLFDSLSDDELLNEVSPGRNRGVYLLGHLIAVHDGIPELIGVGKQSYPELNAVFINEADKSSLPVPSISDLRSYWKKVHDDLATGFNKLSADEWFSAHTAISETDFAREPHRNRLNIIVNRTNHLSYHLGQLVFLK